jgi:hypothetical protein
MRDYLQDLIQHTHGLGCIDLIKVSGTDTETTINAVSDDKTVIFSGTFKNPIAEFIGVFGMPNLGKLKTILSFEDYDEHAKINVVRGTREDPNAPANIHFETKAGDFINDYRLMSKYIIDDLIKHVEFKGTKWNVEFEPSIVGIQRLKRQASASSDEKNFITKTENGDLKIYFGDPSTHSSNFIFHSGVSGTLTRAWNWPVKEFLSIMDLPGDKTVRIGDAGVVEITVDSGLAVYRYLIPAQAK